jgi:hypothetical protein
MLGGGGVSEAGFSPRSAASEQSSQSNWEPAGFQGCDCKNEYPWILYSDKQAKDESVLLQIGCRIRTTFKNTMDAK